MSCMCGAAAGVGGVGAASALAAPVSMSSAANDVAHSERSYGKWTTMGLLVAGEMPGDVLVLWR